MGLHGVEAGEYLYNVAQMDEESGIAYVWRVRIAADLGKWMVERIQRCCLADRDHGLNPLSQCP